MNREDLEVMKVAELKEESRKRGLTLEYKGHKFTKQELIERILKYDAEQSDIDSDIQKAIREAGEETEVTKCEDVKTCVECSNSPCEKTPLKEETTEHKKNNIIYAKTLEEIEQKYSKRKPQEIYDEYLKVGTIVVFLHYITAKSGWMGKKLRTAEVIGINRKKELVRVKTYYGDVLEMSFEDLLFIVSEKDREKGYPYPKDIKMFFVKEKDKRRRAKERKMGELM